MKKIDIIGANTAFGQPRLGVDLGPDAVRYAGLVSTLKALNNEVEDKGNISPDLKVDIETHSQEKVENLRNFTQVKEFSYALAKEVDASLENGRFPLVIGGDHSLSIGSIAGVAKHYDNLGVIWYDAHGDLNDGATSPSGNIHGMPLAVSLGLGNDELVNLYGDGAKIKHENVVLIGMRDLDDGEKEYIKENNIKLYTATDIRKLGIDTVIQEAIAYLEEKTDAIHISLDVDALDPIHTPGTGTPVSGGLSIVDTQVTMETLNRNGKVVSMDLVEVNPLLDEKNRTAEVAVDIAAFMFGKKQI